MSEIIEILVHGIYKKFNQTIIFDDFTHHFSPGITIIKGNSGAGKTTLLRMIAGLETADIGSILLPENQMVSMVFQEDRLLLQLTGKENIQLVDGNMSHAKKLFNDWEMPAFFHEKANLYSGGMKRRLALIRALSVPFDILLLDEPFIGLDKKMKEKVLREIETFKKKIVLLVTHEDMQSDYTLYINKP